MIDYIKAYFPDRNDIFRLMQENYNLDKFSYSRFDKKKNESIHYETYKKKFENMELKITNQEAYIHNSLHHFYNKFVHNIDGNYNDFSLSKLVNSIDFLEDQIIIPSTKLELSQGLEFGLNLYNPPFDIDHFVLNECVLYNFKPATEVPEATENLVYKKFNYGNYCLKIYNKGKHQTNNEPILRVEIKFNDKRDFNKLGIVYLNDLSDRDNLIFLYEKLYNAVKYNLMVVDNLENKKLTGYLKNKLYKYCTHKYWAETPNPIRKKQHKNAINSFEKHNLFANKKTLINLMDNKFAELLES